MTTAYALMNLQERGAMLVGPGVEVYEGMIVGENARADEMDVNPIKEKQLTNHRAAGPTISCGSCRPRDVAGAGARVHHRRRVRRGDAAQRPAAQGRAAAGERGRLRNSGKPAKNG